MSQPMPHVGVPICECGLTSLHLTPTNCDHAKASTAQLMLLYSKTCLGQKCMSKMLEQKKIEYSRTVFIIHALQQRKLLKCERKYLDQGVYDFRAALYTYM